MNDTAPLKKLLMITYVFPPIAYAGTFRSLRLCKYLAKLGYKIDVLTINRQKDLHNDEALLNDIGERVRIIRTMTFDPWRLYQKIKPGFLKTNFGRIINKIISFILMIISMPDHMVLWTPFAVITGYRQIKRYGIPVIYTSSPPHSEQLIGFILKKMTGVKWVADLRDPMIDNIASMYWNSIDRNVHTALEKMIVDNADIILVNTRRVETLMRKRHRIQKVHAVYNAFDEDDFQRFETSKFEKFTIAHIGSLYSFRQPDIILNAIRRLEDKQLIGKDDLCLLFVGLNDDKIVQKVKRADLQSKVEFIKMLPHKEALGIMEKSHLLLLIKGFGANSASQIPGKLFEYLGSGNPILYIGPAEVEAADIIQTENAGYIVSDDVIHLSDVILSELRKNWDKYNRLTRPSYYTSCRMADQVNNFIKDLYSLSSDTLPEAER